MGKQVIQHSIFGGSSSFTNCTDIESLRKWISRSKCSKCGFSSRRKRIVPGSGSGSSGLMIIGQGPGVMENRTGIPFVGRSGVLLDSILDNINAPPRSEIYITNVVKCYGGRSADGGDVTPKSANIRACRPYLNMEVALVDPSVILLFGAVAWSVVSKNRNASNGDVVDTVFGIPGVLSYHPAWALRVGGRAYGIVTSDVKKAVDLLHKIKTESR